MTICDDSLSRPQRYQDVVTPQDPRERCPAEATRRRNRLCVPHTAEFTHPYAERVPHTAEFTRPWVETKRRAPITPVRHRTLESTWSALHPSMRILGDTPQLQCFSVHRSLRDPKRQQYLRSRRSLSLHQRITNTSERFLKEPSFVSYRQ